jgi:hypothetical protein
MTLALLLLGTRRYRRAEVPVSETEAIDAVAMLPEDSWLRTYVIHATRQTTAPLVYHVGIGLGVLGVTCPVPYGTHYAGALRANNFVLCVGRSGEDRKSTALNIGKDLLDQAANSLIGDYPGSAEGLIESLAEQESQFIPISEFGKFLSSGQRGYFEPIKTLLADAWDCHPQQRAKAARQGARVVIRADNPRLSIGAACSIPYLEKHTLAEDWTGGFMGRWLVLYGRRERTDPNPTGDSRLTETLVNGLRLRANMPTAGWCTGLDAEANKTWVDWYHDVSQRKLPGNIVGIRARAPTMARKIALVLGWDYGPAQAGQPWKMDMSILKPALAITELHIKSLIDLSDVIAEHADARMRRSVLDAIDGKGGTATFGEILGRLKMRKRPVMESLEALLEEGRVTRINTSLGFAYELR